MQEPEMLTNHKYDFNIWQETWDPVFSEISEKSRININWLTYSKILDSEYKDCVIKPVNNYVRNLYPAPQLISIENNTVRLRQGNHAEFFLLKKENGNFFILPKSSVTICGPTFLKANVTKAGSIYFSSPVVFL